MLPAQPARFFEGHAVENVYWTGVLKRSCHLIWALSKYYSRNNADLQVIARGTELIPSFRCELRAHVVVDSADGKFRSTIGLTTPSPLLST